MKDKDVHCSLARVQFSLPVFPTKLDLLPLSRPPEFYIITTRELGPSGVPNVDFGAGVFVGLFTGCKVITCGKVRNGRKAITYPGWVRILPVTLFLFVDLASYKRNCEINKMYFSINNE